MRRLVAFAAAASIIAAAGCARLGQHGGAAQPGSQPAPQASTLRYAELQAVQELNPLLRPPQAAGTDLDMFVYGFFFNLDDKMRYVPELATEVPTHANGGVSKDGLTLTYHLRKGVRWQDGAPFTARDVVFTTKAILNAANAVPSRAGWDDIAAVEAVGEYEVRFHLKRIYAPAMATYFCEAGFYPVLPAHLLAKYPNINRVPFNDRPIGTGPFTVVRWVRGRRIELAANPLYWRGKPKIDTIVYEFVPSEAGIVARLKAHDLDAWFRVPPDMYERLGVLPGFRISTGPSLLYTHLDLNQKNPLFDDPSVRRAINMSIDRDAIVDQINRGVADPAYADVSPLSWAYEAHIARYKYDAPKARELLRDDGWTPGADGVLRKNGARLAFTVSSVEGAPTSEAIETLLQRDLRDVGADATVKNYPGDRFFASYEDGGPLYRGDYDAALFSWAAGVDPDDSSEYTCKKIPPAGQNTLYWCDPALDAAERGALSAYDRAARKKYYAVIQEELASQSTTIFLYFSRQIFVTSTNLRGFVPAPATTSNWNTWEWSI